MTDATETDRLLTADEFMALDEPECRELVAGRVVELTPPGAEHGDVAAAIVGLLFGHVRERGLGRVSTCDTAHRIRRDPDTVRGPDVGFVATERIPPTGVPRGYWDLAPDIAVEVVSPSDRWTDVEAKTRDWLDAGTREVWLAVPALHELRVVCADATRLYRAGDEIRSEVLPEFRAGVDDVFGKGLNG